MYQNTFKNHIIKIAVNLNIETKNPSDKAREAWEWATKEGLLDGRAQDFVKKEELAIILEKIVKGKV